MRGYFKQLARLLLRAPLARPHAEPGRPAAAPPPAAELCPCGTTSATVSSGCTSRACVSGAPAGQVVVALACVAASNGTYLRTAVQAVVSPDRATVPLPPSASSSSRPPHGGPCGDVRLGVAGARCPGCRLRLQSIYHVVVPGRCPVVPARLRLHDIEVDDGSIRMSCFLHLNYSTFDFF